MGMTSGLARLSGAANTLQAWEDWEKLACQAVDLGFEDYEIDAPNPQDSWRKIDRHIAKLRKAIEKKQRGD